MDPVGLHVSYQSGWRKNTTVNCGAVPLPLEFVNGSFFCVAYKTWLPRNWKRSDGDYRYWRKGQYHWDAIRYMTRSRRLRSRSYRTHDSLLRDASCRVVMADPARPFGPVSHILQLTIRQLQLPPQRRIWCLPLCGVWVKASAVDMPL